MNVERAKLPTEQSNPATAELDRLTTEEAVALIQSEDAKLHAALAAAQREIAAAVELVAARLAAGGRLLYVGAGTSGRLANHDAVECPPTFQTPPELVRALIAGGPAALTRAVEGAEDDERAAVRDLDAAGLSAKDVVFGVAASGTTPYVRAALARAKHVGAATVFLACVPRELVPDDADVSIRVVTGPEVLTGSTRLKAGTATKLVLNTVSTLVMVRLGRVHGNRMVAVDTRGNAKLVDRGVRLVAELAGLDREGAAKALGAADGDVRVAILMARLKLDRETARARLSASGSLRRALGER